ncbi:hypothetical protein CYMTET_30972 [Cymbomonas tetramitiformis]|uniref:Patatin n=1 Tax=Cymbomonas tetramitiformis TaxID=36881 RepID=A0AAE0KTD5_9CHLO|nr:hypothetical protein CYMTET_30972 [Cymbomonas tetramitiformis]
MGDVQNKDGAPVLSFAGGGMFFYWQLGVVMALRERFDLHKTQLIGASAGSLTATLTACDVQLQDAVEAAYSLAVDNEVFTRPRGLSYVWGNLVRRWLDALLPENAAELCTQRCQLVTLSVPRLVHTPTNQFASREAVIEACLASVHIPYFMDGSPARVLHNQTVIDGSIFLSHPASLLGRIDHKSQTIQFSINQTTRPVLLISHHEDEHMKMRGLESLSITTYEGVQEMMGMGYAYVHRVDARGELCALDSVRRAAPIITPPRCPRWEKIESHWRTQSLAEGSIIKEVKQMAKDRAVLYHPVGLR